MIARHALLIGLLAACAPAGFRPVEIPDGKPPERLSKLELIRMVDGALELNEGVVPYSLNMPLFSDYAIKERAIYVPDGQTLDWEDRWTLGFPVGSAITKTFVFAPDLREPEVDRRLIETRVLIKTEDGWDNWPYVWDEDQEDARLAVSGGVVDLSVVDRDGEELAFSYLVPQRNQCQDCHEREDPDVGKRIVPIGPTSRNLDGVLPGPDGEVAQLDRLVAAGVLGAPPAERARPAVDWRSVLDADWDEMPWEDLDRTARDYLDVNCAHCHNPRAVNGRTSQLFLNWDSEDAYRLGLCKKPGSAAKGTGGRTYDIVPGDHDASILWYRLQTDDVGSMMPDIGRSVVHREGIALIRAWIDRMPADGCE